MPVTYHSYCNGCPYEEARHLSVQQRRVRSAPLSMEDNEGSILLVFQAPGESEWELGRPVISTKTSSAGVRLTNAFPKVGKTRLDFNITNTVQCFPGKQEAQTGERPRDKPPTASARAHCSHWLRQDIEGRKYERVVVFGAHAKKAIHALGYKDDPRFRYLKHPTGGLSSACLLAAVG